MAHSVITEYKDRYLIAYWIILFQGLASAFPWNVFLTETEFFNLRVHQPPFSPTAADNFESINLLTSMAGNILGFAMYVPLHHLMSLDVQVLWPQIGTFVVIAGAIALTLCESVPGDAFMAAVLSAQVVMGVANATITGGVYHMAGWLPPAYIQAMSLGIGLSGTVVSAISFLTLWSVPRGGAGLPSAAAVAPAAFAYFSGAAAVVLLAILTYYIFFMLPYVHFHSLPEELTEWARDSPSPAKAQHNSLRRESASFLRCKTRSTSLDSLSASLSASLPASMLEAAASSSPLDLERPLLLCDTQADEEPTSDALCFQHHLAPETATGRDPSPPRGLDACQDGRNSVPAAPSWTHSGRFMTADDSSCTLESVALPTDTQRDDLTLREVVGKLWQYNLVAALGCLVTSSTFPGVTSAICSAHNAATTAPCHPTTQYGRFFGDLFVPFVFLTFNACDLCGRLVAGLSGKAPSMPPVILYAFLRVPLAAALLVCNVVTPSPWRLRVWLRSDWWPVGLISLLGFTNGHLQSLAFMHAPGALPAAARDRTGPVINFAVAAGTTAGALLSFVATFLLQA